VHWRSKLKTSTTHVLLAKALLLPYCSAQKAYLQQYWDVHTCQCCSLSHMTAKGNVISQRTQHFLSCPTCQSDSTQSVKTDQHGVNVPKTSEFVCRYHSCERTEVLAPYWASAKRDTTQQPSSVLRQPLQDLLFRPQGAAHTQSLQLGDDLAEATYEDLSRVVSHW
jgi:hypothetical protein